MFAWSQSTRSAPVEGFYKDKNVCHPRLLRPPRCSSSVCLGDATKNIPPYIYVIDHLSTKLRIPLSATKPTQGLNDDGLVPGLCRLYLQGLCRQGDFCHQVHADPKVVEALRQEALNTPSCCHIHGAKCNFKSFPLGLIFTLVDSLEDVPKGSNSSTSKGGKAHNDSASKIKADLNEAKKSPSHGMASKFTQQPSSDTVISIHSLCPSSYLWTLYSQNASSHMYLPKNKICREHRKGLCRFGDECNFLHVCREIPIDSSVGSNGGSVLNSPAHSSRLLHLDKSGGSLQSNSPEGSYKWNRARQADLAGSLNHDTSLVGSFGSIDEYNESRQLTSEHACTYSGAFTSQTSNGVPGPLLRPSDPKRSSSNLQRCSVSHNPYMFYLQ